MLTTSSLKNAYLLTKNDQKQSVVAVDFMEINQFCPIQSFVFAVSKNTLFSGKLNEGVSDQLPFSGLLAKWCRTDLGG